MRRRNIQENELIGKHRGWGWGDHKGRGKPREGTNVSTQGKTTDSHR